MRPAHRHWRDDGSGRDQSASTSFVISPIWPILTVTRSPHFLLAPSLGVEALRYALLAPICLLPLMAWTLYLAASALPDDLRAIGAR